MVVPNWQEKIEKTKVTQTLAFIRVECTLDISIFVQLNRDKDKKISYYPNLRWKHLADSFHQQGFLATRENYLKEVQKLFAILTTNPHGKKVK